MNICTIMKKLIMNENNRLNNGETDRESYGLWQENSQNKLDAFLACNRLTRSQYEELSGLFAAEQAGE